jgi:hypothetical protein
MTASDRASGSTFHPSALLAHLYASAPRQDVASELGRLLDLVGEADDGTVEVLLQDPVTNAALYELRFWNRRLAPHAWRDRIGKAATMFWIAQALVGSVMRTRNLDLNATYPDAITRIMERGAIGLFDVGVSQFDALAFLVGELQIWLECRKPESVALIESPTGNTVPVQFMSDALAQSGIPVSTVQWNAPRNDRPSRGRTVEEAAEEFAPKLANFDLVILLDESLSGTRFVKLFDSLADRVGRDRFLPIAMLFDDSQRPDLANNSSRQRLRNRLVEQARRIGFTDCVRPFPQQRLFRLNGETWCRWQVPVIWTGADLIAGKRKVNLVFMVIDHCLGILKDLAANESTFRSYLKLAWSQDTSGAVVSFAPELMQQYFRRIVRKLNIDELRGRLWDAAKERFPSDYVGTISANARTEQTEYYRWFGETFIQMAERRLDSADAGTAWNAIDTAFATSFSEIKPAAGRDLDAALYTLPFNDTVCSFNRRLRRRLLERLAELPSGQNES